MPFSRLISFLLAAFGLLLETTLALSQTVPTSGPVQMTVSHSGQCLDVSGASTADLASIIQWTCHGGTNQQWRLVPVSGGYHVVSVNSGKCMDVNAASMNAGANVIQYPCHSGTNQTWIPTYASGIWTLKAAHSGQCLDVYGASTAPGTQVIQWPCGGAANQAWSITLVNSPTQGSTAGVAGQWSAKISFPIVPVSASMLGNGKLMLWSGSGTNSFGGGNQTYSLLFDPSSNSFVQTLLSNPAREYFCEGTSLLGDGQAVVSGGSDPNTATFMNASGVFSAGPNLNISRGYAGQTLTSDGKVFTLGGSWSGNVAVKKGELYTPGLGWTILDGTSPDDFNTADPAGQYRADNHMWLVAADNGWILHAGPSTKMHWINTSGSGSIAAAGVRGNSDAMNGNAVLYDVGKLLALGGAPSYNDATPINAAFTIDFRAGPGSTPAVAQTGSLANARTFVNSVVLPTGQVVAVGGQGNGATPFTDNNSVYAAEMWDPTSGKFQTLASMTTPRNYHSIAILLMDGRILSAGGGLCNCSADHPDGEIFSPPYLFNADGSAATRPILSVVPTSAARGSQISVMASGALSYALVRMSSVTHSVNNDQRRIPLGVVSTSGTSVTLQIPAASGAAIPGNYMLFAMGPRGTPSVAKLINIR